jgi:glutamate-1-semialdehyde 2,1-aminomutase
MTSVAIIQARMTSTRLPGKVLQDIAGLPALGWTARAARAIPGVSDAIVATSDDPSDDPVAAYCDGAGIRCYRGSLNDVVGRFAAAAEEAKADVVIRLTGDCPFLDPWLSGLVLSLLTETRCDFATNADGGTWPDGLDTEVFTMEALRAVDREATRQVEREHVTPFITSRRDRFVVRSLPSPIPGIARHRWTLDDAADLDFIRRIAEHLPKDRAPNVSEILALLRDRPDIRRVSLPERNEGYAGTIAAPGNSLPRVYDESAKLYKRAIRTVPTASQTFSKSAMQLPEGKSPLFLSHGLGGRVFDVDGNEYVDFMCSLLAVSIGYRDPEIDSAIRDQLNRGISFSLPTRLEADLSERLVELVPSAEAARFGKNGTDATSAAIRIARAYTGRERVIACGYHGWQDWYIGATTRNKGVPAAVGGLTHTIGYNDLPAMQALFDRHDGEIAAVIMEPASFDPPGEGYLEGVRELTRRHGTVLVFDEVVTGFRFALGGAQEMLGVTPDLSCVGKGMGNGMPISAVVGRKDLMAEMSEIFFSGTFGGEALSLAASIAVIDLMRRESVIGHIWKTGEKVAAAVRAMIEKHRLGDTVQLKGWAPWTLMAFSDTPGTRKEAARTLFIREMLAAGTLTVGSNNICYRHGDRDVAAVLAAYERALEITAAERATGALESRLGHGVIEPIFQVRKMAAAKA